MHPKNILIVVTSLLLLSCTKVPPPDNYGIIRAKLKNGVTILVKEDKKLPLVSITTLVKTRDTTLAEYRTGYRALAERIFLEGREKYPQQLSLVKGLMSLGGELTAATTMDYSLYETVLPAFNLQEGLKLFKKAYEKPDITPERYKETINALSREGNQRLEIIEGYTVELLPETTELGKLPYPDFIKYWEGRFHPELLVIAIVGDIQKEKVFRLLSDTFGKIKSDIKAPKIGQDTTETMEFRFSQTPDESGTWGSVTFQTEGLSHKERYPLYLLTRLLKDRMPTQSRIARDSGVVQFTFTPDEEDLLSMEAELFRGLNNIKKTPIPDEKLQLFRAQVVFEQLKMQEKIEELSRNLAIEEQNGDYSNSIRNGYYLAEVTADEVMDLAKKYFKLERALIEEFSDKFTKEEADKEARKKELSKSIKDELPKKEIKISKAKVINELTPLYPKGEKELNPRMVLIKDKIPTIFQERHDLPLASLTIKIVDTRINNPDVVDTTNAVLALRSALHTVQKGDKKTPASIITALGGRLEFTFNADAMGYTLEVISPNLKTALKTIFKLITDPLVSDEAIENERKKMLEELDDQKLHSPFSNATQLALDAAYQFHPYILPQQGRESALNEIEAEGVKDKLRTIFPNNNIIISAAGDFDSNDLQAEINNELAGFQNISPPPTTIPLPPKRLEGRLANIDSAVPIPFSAQTFLFNGPTSADKYFEAVYLLATILAGPTGRLREALIGQLQLAHELACTPIWSKYTGSFAISTQIKPGEEKEVEQKILNIIRAINRDGVSAEETMASSLYAVTKDRENLQGNLQVAHRLSTSWLIDRDPYSTNRFHTRLEKVTAEDIIEASRKYLQPNNYILGLSKSIEASGE